MTVGELKKILLQHSDYDVCLFDDYADEYGDHEEQLSNIADETLIKISIESSTETDELELFIEDTDIDNDTKTIFLINNEHSFTRFIDE